MTLGEITLFETVAREIKKDGLTKFPSAGKLKAELNELSARMAACKRNFERI